MSQMKQDQKDMDTLFSTFTENIENPQSKNFYQDDNVVLEDLSQQKQNIVNDNNVIPKKKRRYSNFIDTKVKTRNLLTNVSYRRFKQSDVNKAGFIIDILSFLLQNFNPINLERKPNSQKGRDMVKFLWDDCITDSFLNFIFKHKNYAIISKPNLTYQDANLIVKKYINETKIESVC